MREENEEGEVSAIEPTPRRGEERDDLRQIQSQSTHRLIKIRHK